MPALKLITMHGKPYTGFTLVLLCTCLWLPLMTLAGNVAQTSQPISVEGAVSAHPNDTHIHLTDETLTVDANQDAAQAEDQDENASTDLTPESASGMDETSPQSPALATATPEHSDAAVMVLPLTEVSQPDTVLHSPAGASAPPVDTSASVPNVATPSSPLKDKPFRLRAQPANLTDNPYKLLVSLAFGTKNALGIRSYEEAHQYFCELARDKQDANAQFAMGWLYTMGKGVIVNHDIASYFFTKSAAQGQRDAVQWLGRLQGDAELADIPTCMTKPAPPPPVIAQTLPPTVASEANVKTEQTFLDEVRRFPRGPIYALVSKHAPSYDIDVDFAMAVIAVESGFNPKAKSPKNAQGLMQLMPETQVRFNVKDPYNPEQNIKGGLSYLRWLLNFFKGDVELVVAAYNAGEHNVLKYRGVPPFQETREYVKKISVYYKKKFHAYTDDGQRVMDKKYTK